MLTIYLCLVLGVGLMALAVWGFDQRSKRIQVEDDLKLEQLHNGYLREQVPFPFVERRLP